VPLPANVRWKLKSVVFRERALPLIESLFAESAITWSVDEPPVEEDRGIPDWTVIIFTAEHGDFERLDRFVEARIAQSEELSAYIERLTSDTRW
jgi:hypothetical protein